MTKKRYYKPGVVTPDEQFDLAFNDLENEDRELIKSYLRALQTAFNNRSNLRGNSGNTLGEKSVKELVLKVEAWKCKHNLPINCMGD